MFGQVTAECNIGLTSGNGPVQMIKNYNKEISLTSLILEKLESYILQRFGGDVRT